MQRFLKPASGSISAVLPVSVQADRPDTEAVSAEQPDKFAGEWLEN